MTVRDEFSITQDKRVSERVRETVRVRESVRLGGRE